MNEYILYVTGIHCNACTLLIEDIILSETDTQKVIVNARKHTVQISTNVQTKAEVLQILNKILQEHGYKVSEEKIKDAKTGTNTIGIALPIGLSIIALFFLLQKSGILNFGIGGPVSPISSFLLGLIASVSSCLIVVGGLILSLSAEIAHTNNRSFKAVGLFHVSRIATFFILGSVLGFIGKTINLNPNINSILGLIAAIIMVLLGLHLIGILTKSTVSLPSGIFNCFKKMKQSLFTPVLLGFATFFLPCGFTQSMQIAALSSGTTMHGGLIMGMFAVGTFPVLGAISFGSQSMAYKKHASLFFQISGIVVIGFGTMAIITSVTALGLLPPIISF